MKFNIKQNGMWWTWHEVCDRCGEVIRDERWQSTEKPDEGEVDFCIDCLKYFLDNNIPYEEAKKELK